MPQWRVSKARGHSCEGKRRAAVPDVTGNVPGDSVWEEGSTVGHVCVDVSNATGVSCHDGGNEVCHTCQEEGSADGQKEISRYFRQTKARSTLGAVFRV